MYRKFDQVDLMKIKFKRAKHQKSASSVSITFILYSTIRIESKHNKSFELNFERV